GCGRGPKVRSDDRCSRTGYDPNGAVDGGIASPYHDVVRTTRQGVNDHGRSAFEHAVDADLGAKRTGGDVESAGDLRSRSRSELNVLRERFTGRDREQHRAGFCPALDLQRMRPGSKLHLE